MRRTGVALLTVAVALGGVVLLLLFLQGRDRSQVGSGSTTASGPGRTFAAEQLPVDVRSDAERPRPSDEQILDLLERGNVVLLYATPRPPSDLRAFAREVAGPFDPALAASGQAVVLGRRPGIDGIVALAWRHALRAPGADDPALEEFTTYWLGRGADG